MKSGKMSWWQRWINIGYNAAKRAIPIEQVAPNQPDIAKLIRKGFAKYARHERRIARMAKNNY